ncbi:hypothetical protein JX266_004589 [Neoarthrinium moseri]|nr:hypothetical protein JX266_004589 [Neoarthrinium moseri]
MESTTSADLETLAAEKSEIQAQEIQDQDPKVHSLAANGSDESHRGVKRAAEDNDNDNEDDDGQDADAPNDVEIKTGDEPDQPLSKNQQRKLKRRKLWEDKREDRKHKRKEKRHNQQERKRLEREAEIEQAAKEGRAPVLQHRQRDRDPTKKTQVPVAIILDCQYENYMHENEMISLSSQVTRSYSDNRTARNPAHLYVSSFDGTMKERFDTTLGAQYKKWKGAHFVDCDFVEAGKAAKELMEGPQGGTVIEVLQSQESGDSLTLTHPEPDAKAKRKNALPEPEPEPEDVDKSIVYLTADSPYILERLEPNTSYVVGGIIDRNRHKGLCYKVARERKVRTAKLPIGEYMVMQDRHVLATNHVVEIMLRWLELGDWGAAFMQVIPMRKGGKLKDDAEGSVAAPESVEQDGAKDGLVEAAEPSEATEATAS